MLFTLDPAEIRAFDEAMRPLDPILTGFCAHHHFQPARMTWEHPHRKIVRELHGTKQFVEVVLDEDRPGGFPRSFSEDCPFALTSGAGVVTEAYIYRLIAPFDWVVLRFSELLRRLP